MLAEALLNWVPEERNHPCQGGVGEAQRHGQSQPDRHSEENGEDSGGRQVEPHLDAVELAQGEEGVGLTFEEKTSREFFFIRPL